MRRSEKAMTEKQARDFLKSKKVGRLGLANDDIPYVVPVHYVPVDNYLYLHSALQGRKIDYLTKNHAVCFEVDEFYGLDEAEEASKYSTFYRSVMISGTAILLKDFKDKQTALKHLVQHCTGRDDLLIPTEAVKRTAVIQIDIEKMTGKQHLP